MAEARAHKWKNDQFSAAWLTGEGDFFAILANRWRTKQKENGGKQFSQQLEINQTNFLFIGYNTSKVKKSKVQLYLN